MKGTILLNYSESVRKVEEDERNRFLYCLLEQMGVPIAEFWTIDDSLSAAQKMKLRNLLTTYDVRVLDDLEGNLEVYLENELVGEWHKCTYKLKKNLRELDPRKRLYLEMEVNYWSIFDDTPENEK